MADDQDNKTEQPTDKRLSEAFDRGQFARSTEFALLFPIAALLGVLALMLPSMCREVAEYSISVFTNLPTIKVERDTVLAELGAMLLVSARAIGPLLLAIVGSVILASGLQSGFRLSTKVATFNLDRLNIVTNFGNTFSKQAFVRTGIDVLKLVAIGMTLWMGTRGLVYDPLFSAPVEVAYLGEFLNRAAVLFLTRLLLALSIVAAVSYAYEKFRMRNELMMSREEVKEEHKQSEGDGRVKGAMRRMARRLMQKQMLSAVETADVVVTNPTHFAVALKYERGKDKAPIVLAKGENRFAQRIKAIAAEHGVPVVENKPVARLLYAMGKVGETIPSELYQAVAEILAVVYRTHRYYFHRLKTRRMEEGV